MGYKFLNQGSTAELFIFGDIAWWGTTADQFRHELTAIEAGKPLVVNINSNGGDPIDATAIYNLLAARKNTTTRVMGIAASAASIIAQAGNPREIVTNGWLMIHEPVVEVFGGNEATLRSAAEGLAAIKSGIVDTYAKRSGRGQDEVRALMAAETWWTGEQAVAAGFADAVVPSMVIQNSARFEASAFSKFKRVPQDVIQSWGLPPHFTNSMSTLSDFLASFKPAPSGPSERETKLLRVLAKAGVDAAGVDALVAAPDDDGLSRVIEAAITTGKQAEVALRTTAESNLATIVAALTSNGVKVEPDKLDQVGPALQARVEAIASKKMMVAAAARGIPPLPTEPGRVNGGIQRPKTLTEQCLEASKSA